MTTVDRETKERHGHCLCGAVKIIARQAGNEVTACHCNMCRRWGGGPFMEIDCGTEVGIGREQDISVYSSSAWAERGFCKKCGTHLFYRLKGDGSFQIPVGLFEDDTGLVFEQQVFIDQEPAYYHFSNMTRNMTGAEIYAKYAAPD